LVDVLSSCILFNVLFLCFRYDRTYWATVLHQILRSTSMIPKPEPLANCKKCQRQFYECHSYWRVTTPLTWSTICSSTFVDGKKITYIKKYIINIVFDFRPLNIKIASVNNLKTNCHFTQKLSNSLKNWTLYA